MIDEAAMKYLVSRGISEQTAKYCRVEGFLNEISFPYGSPVQRFKYRTFPEKKIWSSPSPDDQKGKVSWPFFNQLDFPDKRYLIITEGEFDCLSAVELGFPNAISLPHGAQSAEKTIKDNYQYLQQFQEIYVCFDMDEAGRQAAKLASELLPRMKWRNVTLPKKDLNECLQNGMTTSEFTTCLESAERLKMPSVVSAKDLLDESFQEVDPGISTGFAKLDEIIGGIRKEELTILTGDTGSGKSTFGLSLMYNLANNGSRVYVTSYEMAYKFVIRKVSSMILEDNVALKDVSEEDKLILKQWFSSREFYINPAYGSSSLATILQEIEYASQVLKVSVILLDHLHFFLDFKGNETERQVIDFTVRELVKAARMFNVHIFLVVHPRQAPNDAGDVSMSSLKGSSALKQDAHNVIGVQRLDRKDPSKAGRVSIRVLKNRMLGKEGEFELFYDVSKGTYSPLFPSVNIFQFTKGPAYTM